MTDLAPRLNRLALFFIASFVVLSLFTTRWATLDPAGLLARPENARNLLAEARINRGAILDRTFQPLALTTGLPGQYQRTYPLPGTAPVVGYLSLNYGVAGLEATFDPDLRGDTRPTDDWRAALLDLPQQGSDLQTTLDADWQQRAATALARNHGAVVILAPSGAILALVSAPSYDPNTLDADWPQLIADPTTPLLNRATLGQYRFDTGFEPFIQAAALRFATPTPSANQLRLTWRDLGLTDAPAIRLDTAPIDDDNINNTLALPRFLTSPTERQLLVSPLNVAWATLTIAQNGVRPPLHLVTALQNPDGVITPLNPLGPPRVALPPATAAELDIWLQHHGSAPANATGYAATALQLPGGQPLGWWFGYTADRQLTIVVLVENGRAETAIRVVEALLADQ